MNNLTRIVIKDKITFEVITTINFGDSYPPLLPAKGDVLRINNKTYIIEMFGWDISNQAAFVPTDIYVILLFENKLKFDNINKENK